MCEKENKNLKLTDIPDQNASWEEIATFALTFDGYDFWDTFKKCAEIANKHRHDSLTDLRTCLFFEQRRWRHLDKKPDENSMTYILSVVDKIRNKVVNRDFA